MPRTTKLTITFFLLILTACTVAPATTSTPEPTQAKTVTPKPTVSPEVDAQPEILHRGTIVLSVGFDKDLPASYIDLDKGIMGIGDKENGDMKLVMYHGSMVFTCLIPVNEALAFVHQGENASFDDCAQALSEYSKGNIPDFPENSICVLTNQGKLARLLYSQGVPSSDKQGDISLEFELLVWE